MNKEKILALFYIMVAVFNIQYSFSQNSEHNISSTKEINSGSLRLVPQEYPTIRSAILAAQPLDTILVDAGTYLDTAAIAVNKSLVLIGKGSDSTILKLDTQGNFHFTVLAITASNVVVKGVSFAYLLYYYPPLIRGTITATTIVQNASMIKFENMEFSGLHPMQIDYGDGFNGGDGISIMNSDKIYFKNVSLQGGNGGDGKGHGPGANAPFPGGNGGNAITITSSTEVEATNCSFIAGLGGNNADPGYTFSVSNNSSIYLASDTFSGNYYVDSTSMIVNGPTAVPLDGLRSPEGFLLNQNYPNPFNPTTIIEYRLPSKNFVSLKIIDLLGKDVATLVNRSEESGFHKVLWNGSNSSSGVYIAVLKSGTNVSIKKLLLLR